MTTRRHHRCWPKLGTRLARLCRTAPPRSPFPWRCFDAPKPACRPSTAADRENAPQWVWSRHHARTRGHDSETIGRCRVVATGAKSSTHVPRKTTRPTSRQRGHKPSYKRRATGGRDEVTTMSEVSSHTAGDGSGKNGTQTHKPTQHGVTTIVTRIILILILIPPLFASPPPHTHPTHTSNIKTHTYTPQHASRALQHHVVLEIRRASG